MKNRIQKPSIDLRADLDHTFQGSGSNMTNLEEHGARQASGIYS